MRAAIRLDKSIRFTTRWRLTCLMWSSMLIPAG
nr:MAG TPA: hypothetical protein [Caudoviricetes sp.]